MARTTSPTVMRRLHQRFAAKGLPVLDAPVSGGPKGAQSGRLAVMIGGDAVSAAKELVDELDANLFWQIHRSTLVNTRAISGVSRDARGRQLVAELRKRLPGYAVPRYVRETAGAAHKLVLA